MIATFFWIGTRKAPPFCCIHRTHTPPPPPPPPHTHTNPSPLVVLLQTILRRFLCCTSSLFVHRWYHVLLVLSLFFSHLSFSWCLGTFVRFVLVWICRFPLPLGVWEGLRFVIVALPGLFSYLFWEGYASSLWPLLSSLWPLLGASRRMYFVTVAFAGCPETDVLRHCGLCWVPRDGCTSSLWPLLGASRRMYSYFVTMAFAGCLETDVLRHCGIC